MEKIILASGSPRRRELLPQIGVKDFEIIPAEAEPPIPAGMHPDEAVKLISAAKASEVSAKYPDAVIMAADTVVALGNKILGKPADSDEAFSHLKMLSGNSHSVYTGVTVRRGDKILTEFERSEVFFIPLTDEQIRRYIATGESSDKAGSYALQV